MMNTEQELVLELSRFQDVDGREATEDKKNRLQILLNRRPDMPYVLGQLLFNRMGGAAYLVLQETELLSKVNREFRNTLAAIYGDNREKVRSFKRALADLSHTLADIHVPYAVLKGACLAFLYPEGIRTSNDVDLLVNGTDITIVANALKQDGFEQGYIRNGVFVPASRYEILSSRINRGETVPFIKKTDLPRLPYLEVDINFTLDFQARDSQGMVETFLKGATPCVQTANMPLYTLQLYDFVLHLCAHLYKEATTYPWVEMGRDLSLYKYADLYFMLHGWREEHYDALEKRLRQIPLKKECYYALEGMRMLFQAEWPALIEFLDRLSMGQKECLQEIYKPDEQKLYRHDYPVVEWFFCSDRLSQLKEVADYAQA